MTSIIWNATEENRQLISKKKGQRLMTSKRSPQQAGKQWTANPKESRQEGHYGVTHNPSSSAHSLSIKWNKGIFRSSLLVPAIYYYHCWKVQPYACLQGIVGTDSDDDIFLLVHSRKMPPVYTTPLITPERRWKRCPYRKFSNCVDQAIYDKLLEKYFSLVRGFINKWPLKLTKWLLSLDHYKGLKLSSKLIIGTVVAKIHQKIDPSVVWIIFSNGLGVIL